MGVRAGEVKGWWGLRGWGGRDQGGGGGQWGVIGRVGVVGVNWVGVVHQRVVVVGVKGWWGEAWGW